jgi:hypothetical protein
MDNATCSSPRRLDFKKDSARKVAGAAGAALFGGFFMNTKYFAAMLAVAAGPAIAQSDVILPAPQPVAPPIMAPATTNAILRSGTEVPVRVLEELTTKGKQLRVGNRFHIETSEPVVVQGVKVIPAGTPGVGEITDVRNKGMWGKSGHLNARLLYLTVNGRQIRLAGGFDDKGVAGGVGAVAVSAIVFAPAGFFMTGTSAKIPAGTVVKAFIDEDVPLALPAASAPLVVGEPAPMAPAPAAATGTTLSATPAAVVTCTTCRKD